MKLTAVHVDDNTDVLKEMKILLKSHSEIELVASIEKAQDALNLIPKLRPNILLLDVELDQGTSFDLLKKIDHTNMAIIFITSFEKYAIRAFEFSAVHYLVKPCQVDKLVEVLHRVKQRLLMPPSKLPIESLNENLLSPSKILVDDENGFSVLDLKNILYIEYDEQKRLQIYHLTMHGVKHKTMNQPMKTMYDYLKSNTEVGKHFSRASNDYVLNLDRVARINSSKTEVELQLPAQLNHLKFELSRRYQKQFITDLKAVMLLHKKL